MVSSYHHTKWHSHHFSAALVKAIEAHANPRFLRKRGDKILFNGFWRDGDKQNVCAWPEQGTWHDAKTGEGGGVKEFARITLGLELPQFMERYSNEELATFSWSSETDQGVACDLNAIWNQLKPCKRTSSLWLQKSRGIAVGSLTSSLFADINAEHARLFPQPLGDFIRRVLGQETALISPLINAKTEEVVNFLIRFTSEGKNPKAVFLPGLPVSASASEAPHGFGSPHLYADFPEIILCEGLTDTLAANALTEDNEKVLVIGAPSVSQFFSWGQWLARHSHAKVTVLYHLDHAGQEISAQGIGQQNAIKALSCFANNPSRASLFAWSHFLELLEREGCTNAFASIYDLADACRNVDFAVVKRCFEETPIAKSIQSVYN